MIGVSRTTLWRMVQAGTFPTPVRITERNRGFLLEAVEAWMKARASATDAGLSVAPVRRPRRAGRVAAPTLFPEPAREAAR
jgi:predicted DNA-binding transcriptional regulator AlpA